ncbi:bis(5'-adenosyl)-triphosphatase ENPP4-like [Brevipalpus obovatus]|uniref:bis(5'-adenosyl)-triphosphatase ENPP4-like n=1 Tax=Brevipalpus obovatus TaxID=246614 RepID=UPI003D9F1CEE
MSYFSSFFLLSVVILISNIISTQCITHHDMPPKLILISFDGFRSDYLNPKVTPFMYSLAQKGVIATHMKSLFVTKTFPNHFSIVTGLYEEAHGIVHNYMYDPKFNETFGPRNTQAKWWDNGKSIPIWVANEIYNDDLPRFSGVSMWPGSAAPIAHRLSKYVQQYNSSLTWESRMDTLINWLTREKDPANLAIIYFNQPDYTAHFYGPFSQQVREQVIRADNIVKYLVNRLRISGILPHTNMIIVSDHGMAEVKRDRVTLLDDLIDPNLYQIYGYTPNYGIIPKPGNFDKVFNILKQKSQTHHFTVYRKEEVPLEYHYRDNRRIQPIIIVAEEGWEIFQKSEDMKHLTGDTWGDHGYNNSLPSMRPLFMASGPAFRSGYIHEGEFENIDIYPMMCLILRLLPIKRFPSDGSSDRISAMLKPVSLLKTKSDTDEWFPFLFIIFTVCTIIVSGGACFVFCAGFGRRRPKPYFTVESDVVDIDLAAHIEEMQSTSAERYHPQRLYPKHSSSEEYHLLTYSEDEEIS